METTTTVERIAVPVWAWLVAAFALTSLTATAWLGATAAADDRASLFRETVVAQPIRSRLQPVLVVMDESGATLAESKAHVGRQDLFATDLENVQRAVDVSGTPFPFAPHIHHRDRVQRIVPVAKLRREYAARLKRAPAI